MFFDLIEEEKQLCEAVDRLLGDVIDLNTMAAESSHIASMRPAIDSALADMGLPLILLGEDEGGLNLGLVALAAVAQVIGHHCAPSNCVELAMAVWLVGRYASQAQKERWLPSLKAGHVTAILAVGDGPNEWAPWQCSANLHDAIIPKPNVCMPSGEALLIAGTRQGLAIAKVGPEDFAALDSPLDPTRPLGRIDLPSIRAEFLAGPDVASHLFQAMLILSAADSAGVGKRALALSVEYAKTRQQFGQPIGAFQAVKHQLAMMAVDIEPAHFPCWYAAYKWQLNDPGSLRSALLAKAHATDVAVKTCRAAVEAHGGIAYTWEYPLHLLLKRAMQNRGLLGTPMALRATIAELDSRREIEPTSRAEGL